ncbi:MAG: anaerobic ribonucleoside-triphosphate reductase activating protein [Clostridiales bacterium]|nr:anaerobic ribonucleoside-triphosphate reductase activating protein [Clostridiales bacterium]
MEIFGIEKLSLVDYDGYVAATLFTASCNYRCGFCHNSPLVLGSKSLTPIPTDEIFEYLTKRKGILDGVCISGGEPTLHDDLPKLCQKIKALGYRIKLDTNGTNPTMLRMLIDNKLIDYVAMDIKNSLPSYGKTVGIDCYDTANVQRSARLLLSDVISYEFRTTLIKEYHTKQDMTLIGEWIAGAEKYALQRFKDTGSCLSSGLSEVDPTTARQYLDLIREYVPNTILRGY